ncbi:MAG TPA: hypothetical protein VG650_14610 [Mycobacteriales bacterium]|nr:hypothetical protein [Mycobacteriales bacterium]
MSVLDSFDEIIPLAGQHHELYLRAVAQGVQQYQPPVTMSLDQMTAARSMNVAQQTVLVVEPTDKRLRRYPTLHFASAVGPNLQVGWYLIGGDLAGGHDVGGLGFMNVGGLNEIDVSNLNSIAKLLHQYVVLPAIQQIASISQPAQPGGFFGA